MRKIRFFAFFAIKCKQKNSKPKNRLGKNKKYKIIPDTFVSNIVIILNRNVNKNSIC